jgi:hypothetical protein
MNWCLWLAVDVIAWAAQYDQIATSGKPIIRVGQADGEAFQHDTVDQKRISSSCHSASTVQPPAVWKVYTRESLMWLAMISIRIRDSCLTFLVP